MNIEAEVGSPTSAFKLSAYDGRQIGLSEFQGKSRVVFFFVREYN